MYYLDVEIARYDLSGANTASQGDQPAQLYSHRRSDFGTGTFG